MSINPYSIIVAIGSTAIMKKSSIKFLKKQTIGSLKSKIYPYLFDRVEIQKGIYAI